MPEQRRIIFQHIDEPGYTTDLACYLRNGGYEVLRKAVQRKPEELVDEVKKLRPAGPRRGGISCGVKWTLVDRKSGKPIYLIVNADESEPGTFKDRYIIHQDPHQLIEGMHDHLLREQRRSRPTSTSAANFRRARRSSSGRSPRRGRQTSRAKTYSARATAARSTCIAAPAPTSAARRPG